MDVELKLEELAEQSGVPARTIRLYIAQGIVPGPRRPGPKAGYGHEHLERLAEVRRLQGTGLTLSQIRRRLDGTSSVGFALVPPVAVERFVVAEDVVVEVRGGMAPWRTRQVMRALEQFASAIGADQEGEVK